MNHLAIPADMPAPVAATPGLRQRRRALWAVKQALIVLVVVALLTWLALSVRAGLAKNGIGFDMGFLAQSANFDISDGHVFTLDGVRPFVSSNTNAQALIAGFFNTVKTSLVSIVLATILGLVVGMGRVSHNWLVRQLTFGFVELVRNTPLLIQLVFWYFAVILKMPALTEASRWFGGVMLSQQGVFIPGVVAAAGASIWSIWSIWALLAGVVFLVGAVASRKRRVLYGCMGVAGVFATAVLGFPIEFSVPRVDGYGVTGGLSVSPEFAALLLGLSVYTSAFIAEIVRGAILSLPKGQWEAASALGLSRRHAFSDIVVPQVFRVVLPAFGNQYISLAKTTSLGIAIGFSDLFNVYGTVANTSGRNLEGVIVVMLAYLLLSWTISALVNVLNRQLLRAGGER
jgi:His/Glu/Gln/Arg/opine family amino acid ABC transporter permease subunit